MLTADEQTKLEVIELENAVEDKKTQLIEKKIKDLSHPETGKELI